MRRLGLTFLFIALAPFVAADTQTASTKPLTTIKHNGELLSYPSLLEQQKMTGLSLAVVDNYEVVYTTQSGFKEFGKPDPIDVDTMFSTASISKPIFATLVLMLVEQGKMDLDKPINGYLKRWKLPESELTKNNPVTLRALLSHSAGTSQGGFADFYLGDELPTLIDSLNGKLPRYDAPLTVKFEPGTDWQYSGGGYVLAQVAVEDTTGKSLAELAQTMIFDPLGMKRTTMYQHNQPQFPGNVAKVHDIQQQVIGTGIPICPQIAPSGMWSNAVDMATLLIDFQKALNGMPSKVISPWVAKQSTTIENTYRVGGWGLGWMRMEADGNLEWFSHGGSNTGTGGHVMATMLGGRAIVVFGNGPNQARIPAINSIRRHIIDVMGWQKPIVTSSVKPSKSLLNSMQGRYLSDFDEIVTVKFQDDKLVAEKLSPNLEISGLVYLGNGQFATDNLPHVISLEVHPKNGDTYLVFKRKGTDLKNYMLRQLPASVRVPFEVAETGTFEESLKAYQNWQTRYPDSNLASANALNNAGYRALLGNDFTLALTFFNLYVALYPEDPNAFDSLAEGYMKSGNNELAIKHYRTSLKMNPKNENAEKMLEKLVSL